MIALHSPKIFSQEIASNSAVFRYVAPSFERFVESSYERSEISHVISGVIFEAPDIRSSTIFKTSDGPSEMSLKTRKTINKIKSYSLLEKNWDGYGANIPEDNVINKAIEFLRLADLESIVAYFVAPGPNGEILIEFKNDKFEAEIYFNQNMDNQILIYDRDECVFEGSLEENYEEFKNHLSLYVEA